MCALIFLFSYRPSIQLKDRPPKCPRAPCATALRVKITRGVRFVFPRSSHKKVPDITGPRGAHDARVGGAPRGRRRCSERARGFLSLREKTCGAALRKIPREPDSRPRIVEKRPIVQRTTYGNHTPHRICAEAPTPTGSAPRYPTSHSHTPHRICAEARHTTKCAGWPLTCTALPKPPAGPSEGLA